jgi:FkbM family methyltransferase
MIASRLRALCSDIHVELYFNSESPFTRWVVQQGLLRERLVVIDAGCQGGVHVQWDLLGDLAEVHAFDAIAEAVEELARREVRPHRHYYNIALGSEDGQRKFFVKPNVFSSSFIAEDGRARFVVYGPDIVSDPQLEPRDTQGASGPGARITTVRRLDALFAQGALPPADFIKLDCEGFEPEILAGARQYMRASKTLAVVAETNFLPVEPGGRTQFDELHASLLEQGLRLFDLVSERLPRPEYLRLREARHRTWPVPADPRTRPPPFAIGQFVVFDILFCRDLVAQSAVPEGNDTSIDRILKMMIIFEMHGLMDCATELASHFRERLGARLDVDRAIDLLLGPPPHARNLPEIVDCLATIAQLRTALEAK